MTVVAQWFVLLIRSFWAQMPAQPTSTGPIILCSPAACLNYSVGLKHQPNKQKHMYLMTCVNGREAIKCVCVMD